MKKEVEHISVTVCVYDCNHASSVDVIEFDECIDDKNLAFAEACDILLSLEKMGIDSFIRCYTYSILVCEDSKE